MKTILVISLLLLAGCMTGVKMRTEKYDAGKLIERQTLTASFPKYAEQGSYVNTTVEGFDVFVSESQPVKNIHSGAQMKLIYIGLLLLFGLSVAVLFLPEWIVSNKDALIGIACVGLMFVIVKFAEASAPVMAWVVPVSVVGGLIYLVWRYVAGKKGT